MIAILDFGLLLKVHVQPLRISIAHVVMVNIEISSINFFFKNDISNQPWVYLMISSGTNIQRTMMEKDF